MKDLIIELGERVLAGGEISGAEAGRLLEVERRDLPFLLAYADRIREERAGRREVDTCAVVSARTGGCSEDCAFCAQAARHRGGVEPHRLLPAEEILERGLEAQAAGAKRFDIVTSGRRAAEPKADWEEIVRAFRLLRERTSLSLCASLGTLDADEAAVLRDAGVSRYNHNLEAARSFYPRIVTTHAYDERVGTIQAVKAVGMEVCSGGIIGLGETPAQRVELALELRGLGVDAVPLNVLNPRPGTPLGERAILPPLEVLKTLSVFRFILPAVNLRYAGGREAALRDLQGVGLLGGVDGLLLGNYLTTAGRDAARDLALLRDLEMG